MRRLPSVATLGIAFILSYVGTPRGQEDLQAQVNIPCSCVHLNGQLVNTVSCVGTGDMSNWSCSQIGNQCFLSGTATWLPRGNPMSCAWPTGTSGWINPTGLGTGPTSYFNPWNIPPHTTVSVPWNVTSIYCGPSIRPFGAQMWVIHDLYTLNPNGTCTCFPNTPQPPLLILANQWTCKDS